jgi:hypothetical protein
VPRSRARHSDGGYYVPESTRIFLLDCNHARGEMRRHDTYLQRTESFGVSKKKTRNIPPQVVGAYGSCRVVGFPRELRDRASGIEIATMLFV